MPPELVTNLDDWFRIELTYTSNAIDDPYWRVSDDTCAEDAPQLINPSTLLKIGPLSKLRVKTTPTIRYGTSLGLLVAASKTEKGYALYAKDQLARIEEIIALKGQRYTLEEIGLKLGKLSAD